MQIKNESLTKYRADIDGLRALAVLAILFFHAGFSMFSGGFIGVDVFFVISGYLITRNIANSIEQGKFSLRQFYVRRFRRLFPALITTLLLTALISSLILSPEHLQHFGKELLSSMFSVSNFYFWSESGYFDLDAEFKPLLHTWSLSVEEQFYLLWPTTLLVLLGFNRKKIAIIFILLTSVFSLLIAEYWVHQNSSTAFYLLPARIFEFGLGALLVWVDTSKQNKSQMSELIFSIGLILIIIPIFTYNASTPFPGLYALVPSIGAAMIIYSGEKAKMGIALRNRACVAIGLISYSLYLIHWPLIVLYKYWKFTPLTSTDQVVILFTTVTLAGLMWRFVEQPFRHNAQLYYPPYKIILNKPIVTTFTTITIAALLGASMWSDDGWSWRYPSVPFLGADAINEGKSDRFTLIRKGCRIDEFFDGTRCDRTKSHQVLIFGNSHEPDGYNIWHTAFGHLDNQNIIQFGTTNKCGTTLDANTRSESNDNSKCRERLSVLYNDDFIEQLDVVIYSSNHPFSGNKEDTFRVFHILKDINPNIKFVFLGGYLNTKKDCSAIYGRYHDYSKCGAKEYLSYTEATENAEKSLKRTQTDWKSLNPFYISKFELLCDKEGRCTTDYNGTPYTFDQHHLSMPFATHLGQLVREKYTSRLEKYGALPSSAGAASMAHSTSTSTLPLKAVPP